MRNKASGLRARSRSQHSNPGCTTERRSSEKQCVEPHCVRAHIHRRAHNRVHILCTAVCSPLCVHMGCARNRAHSLLLLLPLLLLMLCWYTLHCTPQVFRLHHSRPWCTTAVPNKQGKPKQATVNVQKKEAFLGHARPTRAHSSRVTRMIAQYHPRGGPT